MANHTLILRIDSHFGPQLKAARKKKRMTQKQVAIKMGCSDDNVGYYERCNTNYMNTSLDLIFRFSMALGFNQVKFILNDDYAI